jgi:hypothetical protein
LPAATGAFTDVISGGTVDASEAAVSLDRAFAALPLALLARA